MNVDELYRETHRTVEVEALPLGEPRTETARSHPPAHPVEDMRDLLDLYAVAHA